MPPSWPYCCWISCDSSCGLNWPSAVLQDGILAGLLHRLELRALLQCLNGLLLCVSTTEPDEVLLRLKCACAALHKRLHEFDKFIKLPLLFVNASLAVGHLRLTCGCCCICLRLCAGQLADQLPDKAHG
jgi:hypothetical protein